MSTHIFDEKSGANNDELSHGLAAVLDPVTAGLSWLDSLMVIHNGELLFERYFNEGSPDALHDMHSVTKNWLCCMVGIALDKGLLSDIDQPVCEVFQERLPGHWDSRKSRITLRHCLKMQSGLDYQNTMEFAELMGRNPDPVDFFFGPDLPVVADPGTHWCYSGADSQMIAEALRHMSQSSLSELAREWLAEPLGITRFEWPRQFPTPGAQPWPAELGCAGLMLTPRDFAKFVLCVSQDGEFGGRSVVPANWLREATIPSAGVDGEVLAAFYREIGAPEVPGISGYGMHIGNMKLNGHEIVALSGAGGQYGFIVKALDVVVVQTANFSGDGLSGGALLLRDTILPAVTG
ncbi:serine hydrolase domain-containing protein [Pseudohaliea sp.]|uniref:serine hydrolase domain-containing protein n=1 Tax=Pseudohaliea sp. TaxID=2740289 RepID=UPI0032F09B2C